MPNGQDKISNDQFARGKERSYPAFLESKLAKLQKKLYDSQLQPRRARDGSLTAENVDPALSRKSSQSRRDASPQLSPSARKQEANDIDDLVSNFGVLSVNATARDFEGFTSLMSLVRLLLAAATKEQPPGVPSQTLPSRSEATRFGEHYLSYVHPFSPVIAESSFWTSLEAVYHPNGYLAGPMDHWTLRMVFAISAISQSTHWNDEWCNCAIQYVLTALTVAEHVLRPDSVENLQAMLLLIEYAKYDPRWFDQWTLVGAVSRTMVDLGLHQDPAKTSSLSKSRLEKRRKTYLCVYLADRSTSMALERGLSFNDVSTNVALPQPDPHPSWSPSNQTFIKSHDFAYALYQLRQIQSMAYQDMHQTSRVPFEDPYAYVWARWSELQDWYSTLPPSFSTSIMHFAELELLYSCVFLLAPSPAVPHASELAQSLIFEYGLDYLHKLRSAMSTPSERVWLTSVDARRALGIGHIFITNLTTYKERLLAGTPPSLDTSTATKVPSFPHEIMNDNAQRCLAFVQQMADVLKTLGTRFGVTEWHDAFREESSCVVETIL
ncbi:MAG: hypothetical protein M1828_006427 [Chrysothrix sp. TS-e1954]|nr:MAG: hypothetical protein M1828_006427 [Chrysothrix sp. TS-e1954]